MSVTDSVGSQCRNEISFQLDGFLGARRNPDDPSNTVIFFTGLCGVLIPEPLSSFHIEISAAIQ
jgi:hypothetical protein